MKMYSMSEESFINNCVCHINQAKELLLKELENDGLLKEPAENIASRYAVIIHKRGWLGSIIDKFLKLDKDKEDQLYIKVVKL